MATELTKEGAIRLLWRYYDTECMKPTKQLYAWKLNYDFIRASYEEILIDDLIQRIRDSNMDPMDVIRAFYYEMSDVIAKSERRLTWAFASTLENCIGDILRYIRKERNEEND